MPDNPPAQGAQRTARRSRIILAALAIVAAVPAIAVAILLVYDWNQARPWLNAKVSEAIERPFAIRGTLAVQWKRPAEIMTGGGRAWRDYLPWPHLIANDVHVGNPVGMPARDMASVRRLSFSLNPFALLGRRIAIPVLRFDDPRVELLRTDATHSNWTFKQNEEPSRWKLGLERVVLARGVVHVTDAVTNADVTADIDTLENNRYGIGWILRGTYNGARIGGGGKAGTVLSLRNQDIPYPIQAELRAGATRIAETIYGEIRGAHDWGRQFPETLGSSALERLASLPPREMRRAIHAAFGNAKVAGRTEVGPDDINDGRASRKSRIGF